MRIATWNEIAGKMTNPEVVEAVRQSFLAFSAGKIVQPEPVQILFNRDDGTFYGDCHAKAAQGKDQPYFVIKIAASFYDNAAKGLPNSNGMVVVMSATTGQPVAILQDEGWLTQLRTAAAGVLAASLKPVGPDAVLGVIGTGTQARLQAQMISEMLGIRRVFALGRTPAKTDAFVGKLVASGLDAHPATSARHMCDNCAIVVTATPASAPVLMSDDVTGPLHIVAVGADSPGKVEIDPGLVACADIVATDSHAQCLHHGDFGVAVREGLLEEDGDVSFCDILAGMRPEVDFAAADISMVDLTGLGVQDLFIAQLAVEKIGL